MFLNACSQPPAYSAVSRCLTKRVEKREGAGMCGGHSWHAGPLQQRHVPMGSGWPADARFSTLAGNRLQTALQAGRLAAGLAIHVRRVV